MNLLQRAFIIALLACPLAACDSNDGPAEKTGEKIDETFDKTRDAVGNAADEIKDGAKDTCEKVSGEDC